MMDALTPIDVTLDLPMPPSTNNLFAGNGKRRYRTAEYNAGVKKLAGPLFRRNP